jgi:rare lipoprotein A
MELGKRQAVTTRLGLNLSLLVLLSCGPSSQARSPDWPAPPPYPAPAERGAEESGASAPGAANRRPRAGLSERYEGRPALQTFQGEASYYSQRLAGRPTASGETYDPKAFTAAHRSLPFGTVLRVVRLDDGRAVYVRINDRGPFGKQKRVIDLSYAAAEELAMLRAGVVAVRAEVVALPDRTQAPKP